MKGNPSAVKESPAVMPGRHFALYIHKEE
jgi:hypothetical protein